MIKMQRPHTPDPITVTGMRQNLVRQRRYRCLGCGCGHWLMGIMGMLVSISLLCGMTTLLYVTNPPERINILVVGVDARANDDVALARTDSVMIVSIDPRREQVTVLSIPRDVVIGSPNFGRLPINLIVRNAELVQAGSGLTELEYSIEGTFNINIDHTVRVNFEGFVDVVDAVGGVKIDVPKRIVDNTYPTADGGTMVVEFDKGEQTMDGERALIYARTRHSDDDYQRAGRQQQVVAAIIDKVTNPLNLYRVPLVMVAVGDNTETTLDIGDYFQITPGVVLYGRGDNLERLVLDREWLIYDDTGKPSPNLTLLSPWLDEHLR